MVSGRFVALRLDHARSADQGELIAAYSEGLGREILKYCVAKTTRLTPGALSSCLPLF